MMNSSTAFVVLLSLIASTKASTCGYDSCPRANPDPNVINVHVVPHSHDDVGWLKTIDQYYYGSSSRYQKAGVQYILSSVIKELQKDPTRRFIYVETGFFWQWWQEQSDTIRDTVRQLVAEGRLEFINGGWCMNDEAATHYVDIIDQMTLGLRFLNETFGECGRPRVAWHIDPFGHSREQASIFALMGFDAVFFGRIDREDKARRLIDKEMEMVWHASNSLGERGSLFTSVNFNDYAPPPGFCFDVTCTDTPIIDDPRSPEHNVDQMMSTLIDYAKRQAKSYATNNIMFTMGEDFHYMAADMNFKNMDKMIRYANARNEGVNLFYSTPSCYIKAVNEAGRIWPTKTDDFFPYSSDAHAYWTGYFTSRPAFKGTLRKTSTFLQSCKQLHTLADGFGDSWTISRTVESIDSLRRSMAEAQHHDAATGTEKDHVSQDYRLRIHDSTLDCQDDVADSLQRLMRIGSELLPQQQFCLQLNASLCPVTETNSRFTVTVYNPLSHHQTAYVRFPVNDDDNAAFTLLDPDGSELVVQLMPHRSLPDDSTTRRELVFQAAKLPPLGHKTFYVVVNPSSTQPTPPPSAAMSSSSDLVAAVTTITNERISANFNADGLLESVVVDGELIPLSQNLMWYAGMKQGNSGNYAEDRPSGAYVFRPSEDDASPVATTATLTNVIKGQIVQEVHQQFNDWCSQVVRIYKGRAEIEIEWTVGPIPVEADGIGKEIINRVTMPSLASNGLFYTDSNGRQTLERRRNHRPTWTMNVSEPIASNYYPINSHIYITNGSAFVALVTDRSQGGTSLHDGEIELMVHRRLLYDDHFGVGESLNEPGDDGKGLVVRGTHYLVVGSDAAMSAIRPLAQEQSVKPWMSFSATDLSYTNWKLNFRMEKSGLTRALPDNIQLLTLEPWREGTQLLRLEHVYDIGEHAILSQPVTIDLQDLLADFVIVSAEETVLGGNQWASDSSRLVWTSSSSSSSSSSFSALHYDSGHRLLSVTLAPMDLKTYIIVIEPRQQKPSL